MKIDHFHVSLTFELTKVVIRRCSVKKVLLEISQNSQENTCASVFRPVTLFEKETLTRVFSCEF